MMRYLTCYNVEDNGWRLDDICDGSVEYRNTNGNEEEQRFMRQDQLLAKLIASSLSCTLAQQVMRFDYGSDMWNYLATRFEGRENEMTTLYTQRAVRQKLESASCRPGADVENHLLYMMGLCEQLVVLDADVSDSWIVDFMVRSVSQLPFYRELRTLMLTGGLHTMKTPDQVKSMILVLDKEELVDK
ncbi:gag-polypeptide of LTR copia-type [Phytophthora infestans]|uniref:Gag-polypeptide of LTR copia-type n=1 Tax=Phytophthora infestans TaxID=4787 RepID=A0A833W815_PHYIN|nr:gag-polypeptide of LTR copia-type [Phytophthora infestans]